MSGTEEMSDGLQYLRLQREARDGARWFWWVGGLSAVNTIITISGGQWNFFMGLGLTQVFDAFARGFGGALPWVALVLDIAVIIVFGVLGELAQLKRVPYMIGMALYALDGLLVLAFQAYLAAAFHALGLVFMYRGYVALGRLQAVPMPAVSIETVARAVAPTSEPVTDTGYFDVE